MPDKRGAIIGGRMPDFAKLLADTKTILLIDWPSREVPDSLARRGFIVISNDGPDVYNAYEMDGEEIRVRSLPRLPKQADLVYTHRPVEELPEIVETAKAIGARAIWLQSGRDESGDKDPCGCWLAPVEEAKARAIVEAAGLVYVDKPYIVDAVQLV